MFLLRGGIFENNWLHLLWDMRSFMGHEIRITLIIFILNVTITPMAGSRVSGNRFVAQFSWVSFRTSMFITFCLRYGSVNLADSWGFLREANRLETRCMYKSHTSVKSWNAYTLNRRFIRFEFYASYINKFFAIIKKINNLIFWLFGIWWRDCLICRAIIYRLYFRTIVDK